MQYKIIRSDRKTLSICVNELCEITVRAPKKLPISKIKSFVDSNADWINNAVEKQEAEKQKKIILDDGQIKKLKAVARVKLKEKADYFSQLMGVEYKGLKITSAKKRFGSCSTNNSLCFSYILLLYPEAAIDYVVVHELAHIRHHNHSKDFYNAIAQIMPDYKNREVLLKSQQILPDFI